jgi:hypothetical protein
MDFRHVPRVAGRTVWLRALILAMIIVCSTGGSMVAQEAPGATPASGQGTDCAAGAPAEWTAQMDAYAGAGAFPLAQSQEGETIDSVQVEVPAIEFTGEGQSATLPVGPCQTIYRFAYSDVSAPDGAATPFAYVEVDWNTEGEPRGPNGSFSSPHFDFHFYLLPKAEIDHHLTCVSTNGKTCDAMQTSYDQMQLFQSMPDSPYVPESYRPDVGSAIPEMGLHLLDSTFEYTVENVNHNPVLIYGTFDREVVFAEASVTLYTLQDVIAAPDQTLSWDFAQPQAFAEAIDWPTEFTIQYLPETGGFLAGFTNFVHHEVGV